jgi:hypothetical protein
MSPASRQPAVQDPVPPGTEESSPVRPVGAQRAQRVSAGEASKKMIRYRSAEGPSEAEGGATFKKQSQPSESQKERALWPGHQEGPQV